MSSWRRRWQTACSCTLTRRWARCCCMLQSGHSSMTRSAFPVEVACERASMPTSVPFRADVSRRRHTRKSAQQVLSQHSPAVAAYSCLECSNPTVGTVIRTVVLAGEGSGQSAQQHVWRGAPAATTGQAAGAAAHEQPASRQLRHPGAALSRLCELPSGEEEQPVCKVMPVSPHLGPTLL